MRLAQHCGRSLAGSLPHYQLMGRHHAVVYFPRHQGYSSDSMFCPYESVGLQDGVLLVGCLMPPAHLKWLVLGSGLCAVAAAPHRPHLYTLRALQQATHCRSAAASCSCSPPWCIPPPLPLNKIKQQQGLHSARHMQHTRKGRFRRRCNSAC